MKHRTATRKVIYSIGELADLFGLHRNQIGRLLESAHVEFEWIGNRRYVTRKELKERLPRLWESVFIG